MTSLSSLSNPELVAMLSAAVRTESAASAEVIAHLAELDRRKLYLEEACSSLFAYCVERLGYSDDSAVRRVRVARAAQRWPRVTDELASGAIHLTGLVLLSDHLTDENADSLLDEARGLSKRQIQELLARRFPRPAVHARMTRTEEQMPLTRTGHGNSPAALPLLEPARVEPEVAPSYRLELGIGQGLWDKLEKLRNLLGHTVPSGDLAVILERAVDAALEKETKRLTGAEKPRKERELTRGSRHIPVKVQREVRERDGEQCTFVDAQGRRCSEKRFLTIEHDDPHALGGEPTVENCRLLCSAHNAHMARQVFGEEHVQRKINEALHAKVLSALVNAGFKREPARRAIAEAAPNVEPRAEALLRAAILRIAPPAPRH